MKHRFSNLIDVAKVQQLTDLFHKATGIPASIIGLDGVIITGSGWQDLCTNFHRANPETTKGCIESDTVIANQVAEGQTYTLYKCKNGLIDAAAPIVIDGEHVANFFTGQFLFEAPDGAYFQKQARRYGFDEAAYMSAVEKIPIIEEVRLRPFLEFLAKFASFLGEIGLKQLKKIEAEATLKRYDLLAQHARDIILFLNGEDGRVLEANAAAISAYGYARDELLSLNIQDLRATETQGETSRQMAEASHKGLLFETVHRRKDGCTFPVEVSSRGETIDHVPTLISVVRDITDRRRAEAEVTHLASFPQLDPNPVLEVNASGEITFCNAAARTVLDSLGLDHEGCRPFLPADIGAILENLSGPKEEAFQREVTFRHKVFEEHIYLCPQFGVARIYGSDITGRKVKEDHLGRLSRLYAMLSRANEAIVRTRDKTSLYEEVCAIVAGVGAFPLVWIGEIKGRQVVPVTSCGPAATYLKEVRIETEGALGQGPTGTAIREDRVVVNHDFEINSSTSPWREPALRYRLRASAAFPLHCQNRVSGVLTLYTADLGNFDAEQVELLQALSADISYALDTMEQERLRVRAEMDRQGSLARFALLAHTAGELLQNPDPQKLVNSLCKEVMEHLDCQAFFNFLVVPGVERLRLNAYAGIPEEEARKIEWLDYGVAVCGCAARDACGIVVERIPTTPDPRTELVESYGIKAYAAHPLLGPDGMVIGTLSFGTRTRETFQEEDLSLMKAVADQVSAAMIRMRAEERVKRSRDELEERVAERTAELQNAYDRLIRETQEREKVEQQLRQAQKMEALGTLAGGIAHDFNNILAAIIGFTELMKDHLPEGSREHRHAQRVIDAGVRGRELVKQMLTYSRQTEQEKKPLRLSSIIKECLRLLRASVPTTVSIRLDVESESGVILGDPIQIQQVLMNLATNAAHAMRGKGGSLEIALSDFSISSSEEGCHGIEPGTYVRLAVKDTGTGMSPEIMEKIFDPFFTTKKVGEGTGLGLSVVLGIVKQSRGYITVESQLGKGSTFTVYFPKIVEQPVSQGMAVDDPIPTGQERILFIDDEEVLAEMGEDLLAELGYEVTCRTSSRAALALFRLDPFRFDLVITDQTMPDLNGIDLAREILAIRPNIPVILSTGFSHSANEETANAAGIKAFALKPLTKKEIALTIRSVLDQSQKEAGKEG